MQKFGSYEGNNNANGPYVGLGFRPAVLMVKRTEGANANWYIMDNKTQVDQRIISEKLCCYTQRDFNIHPRNTLLIMIVTINPLYFLVGLIPIL